MTDVGAVRSDNQDSFQIEQLRENVVLAVICDGMGGANAGNVASELAGSCFVSAVREGWNGAAGPEEPLWPRILEEAAQKANAAVHAMSVSHFEMRGMGTTLVGALVTPEQIWVVNIGDSRCYGIENGVIRQISRDHSVVGVLLERGEITPEQARVHPQKHLITRSVGVDEDVMADVFECPNRGGYLLLCSDGLSNVLTDAEICAAVLETDGAACCQKLRKLALEAGAPDNITVILVQL